MALGNKLSILSLASVSSVLAMACGGGAFTPVETSSGSSDGVATTSAALDTTNGGLNVTSQESPAFADTEIEALPAMDSTLAALVDPTDPTLATAAMPGATAYRIALVWGHLPPPHDADTTSVAPQVEDWDGAVSVAAGAIGLKRTIAFDPNDHIDYPRANAQMLSFTSHTLPYVDGVLLRVVIPSGGTPTLHFATSALTTDIDLSQLAAKEGGVVRLANDVEGLGWIGFPEDGCARGFVHGRWIKQEANLGRTMGVVSDGDGNRIGYTRGIWGYSPKRAENVWFSKIIDLDGTPKGLAFGKYGEGAYAGLWGAADENHIDVGTTEGVYSDGYDVGDGRGVWLGRWSAKCPATAADAGSDAN
jgi:hypothetical protein